MPSEGSGTPTALSRGGGHRGAPQLLLQTPEHPQTEGEHAQTGVRDPAGPQTPPSQRDRRCLQSAAPARSSGWPHVREIQKGASDPPEGAARRDPRRTWKPGEKEAARVLLHYGSGGFWTPVE